MQIDVPETLGLGKRSGFYEQTGAYRDMVVTHLFQILGFMAMEAPTSLEPTPISEEKNKVFRSMLPVKPADVIRGQYTGYRTEEGGAPRDSDTETFIALRCFIDNWRWAGVPFYLRTGKRLAQGQRIISIAFKEPPKSMFPAGSGVSAQGPDHLTFDLADAAKMSLSFYGKRPGPGMRLDKLSMQFAMHDTGHIGDVLEAYERLILDAMRGDHTLFTTADGSSGCGKYRPSCSESAPPVPVLRSRVLGRTPSTNSSRRMPGGCPSRGFGGIRTAWGVDRPTSMMQTKPAASPDRADPSEWQAVVSGNAELELSAAPAGRCLPCAWTSISRGREDSSSRAARSAAACPRSMR